jgi:membrane protein YqaA with SNARE-associated domain
MGSISVYAGLFTAAFLAATLLPAQSEAVLVGLLMLDRYPAVILLSVASAGNVLGSCVNYALGRFIVGSKKLARFVDPAQQKRAEQWYRTYGRWSLLASWLPLIGDPITVAAGMLREPLLSFFTLVTVAKVGRYMILVGLHQAWFG